jgi:TetR/AcrR family transcriptional regulator of autoinduction and epiphytic fitness
MTAAPVSGSLAGRIAALVERRAALYEQITPVRRAAVRQEPFSRVVAEKLQWSRAALRAEVMRIFASELARLPASERHTVRDALGMATSWSAWETLRRHAGLSVARTARAVARTLTALLQPRHTKESS